MTPQFYKASEGYFSINYGVLTVRDYDVEAVVRGLDGETLLSKVIAKEDMLYDEKNL